MSSIWLRGYWRSLALAVSGIAAWMTFAVEAAPKPTGFASATREAGEPVMAIVSLESQQVTLYDAEGWILRAPVSTGTTGRETPAGVFAIVEKNRDHRSNMYDDAAMPHMQRITWNGIALHGGPLPGYAASHGCVRLPYGFAENLFDQTRIGMRVIISPADAAPVEIDHPLLFSPDAERIAAAPGEAEKLAHEASEAAKAYPEARKFARSAAREVARQKQALRKLERRKQQSDAKRKIADRSLVAALEARGQAEQRQREAASAVLALASQLETPAAASGAAQSGDAVGNRALPDAERRKLERLKTSADTQLKRADAALAVAEKSRVRAQERQSQAEYQVIELAMQVEIAKAGLQAQVAAAADAEAAIQTAKARKAETAKAAAEAKLALEPASLYISRATQTLYVRRNTHKPAPDGGGEVFDDSIQVAVEIRDPDRPIGTHVFTAMAQNAEGLRWTAVTIDGVEEAGAALDRVRIPQDVLARIAPTALPRSSIIISDEPLSAETNYRTEFVAVLSNQPQGGFITHKVPRKEAEEAKEADVADTAQDKAPSTPWKASFVDL